ncbi:MAG: tryptophan synthase subunit alpha [Chloroherpetonaceae bacterium]|nr:tryptophan synthase subunit alpha [Chloroherpetonaceae bacterium]
MISQDFAQDTRLQRTLKLNQKLLVAYQMPEFPCKDSTIPLLFSLENSGVSIIELGMPHSDPLADGPIIQEAAQLAIQNGVNLPLIFSLLKEARMKGLNVPVILMGYINPVVQYGLVRFFKDAKESGADGFIFPDIPPEESEQILELCKEHSLSLTFLISPVSSNNRISKIDSLSTDFSYCLTVNAVTGSNKLSGTKEGEIKDYLGRVKENSKKKFVAGFGISNRNDLELIFKYADGAVIGSAYLRALKNATSSNSAVEIAESFFKSLKGLVP